VAEAMVKWIGDEEFVGTDSTRHSVVMSGQPREKAAGLKPSELLLVALAGCTGIDVVSILKKRRQNPSGLEIQVTGEQDPDPPWTFRKIHLEYTLRGTGLTVPGVEQAIKLAEEKYCSVGSTLSGVAEITSSYTIIDYET
jgi:putative redox protein